MIESISVVCPPDPSTAAMHSGPAGRTGGRRDARMRHTHPTTSTSAAHRNGPISWRDTTDLHRPLWLDRVLLGMSEPHHRPRRNPAFSTTSKLEVLRDDESIASASSLRSLSPVNEEPPSRAQTDLFATDVRVRGWHRVGTLMRGWIVYVIYITTRSGTVIKISKRYSAFLSLHERLEQERGGYAHALPPLPPRHVGLWQRYHPLFLEDRRRALQQWLCATLLDERWGNADAYQRWVLER